MIDELIETGKPSKDAAVLCTGPRNTFEIDLFRERGFSNVVGIDLFSESPDICIMDMHDMTFADNSFDIIYSCHSLEHSYDVKQAVSETVRVARDAALIAIEVPVRYDVRGADLVDFENLENLCAVFEPHIDKVLWSEEQPPYSPRNDAGTSVVRTLFSICKKKRTVCRNDKT